jgi:hypothetical protein
MDSRFRGNDDFVLKVKKLLIELYQQTQARFVIKACFFILDV